MKRMASRSGKNVKFEELKSKDVDKKFGTMLDPFPLYKKSQISTSKTVFVNRAIFTNSK